MESLLTIPQKILNISKELHTQDNRWTSDPVFMVQRKIRHIVPYGYSDTHCWVDGEGDIVDKETAELLDMMEDEDKSFMDLPDEEILYLEDFSKEYFHWKWENVQPFFTKAGADDYIRCNGHNLGGEGMFQIYVESGWRNMEWQAIREYLMGLSQPNSESEQD